MLMQPDSWHTIEYKLSSINCPINRLHAYPITTATKLIEINIIQHPTKQPIQLQTSNPSQNKQNHNTQQNPETPKWNGRYSYTWKKSKTNHKLFKNIHLKITHYFFASCCVSCIKGIVVLTAPKYTYTPHT